MEDCQPARKKLVHQHLELLTKEESDALTAHLARCPECLKAYDEIGADFTSFKLLRDEDPPGDAIEAVLAEARRVAASRKPAATVKAAAAGPAPECAPDRRPPAPAERRKSDAVDLAGIFDDDSVDALEKDLKALEQMASSRSRGGGTEIDLSAADVFGPARKQAGDLTEDQREKLLKELGLDEDQPAAEQGEGAAPTLENLAGIADQAARRKSLRSRSRKVDPDEWEKMCGTTSFNAADVIPKPAEGAAGPRREGASTDEWLAMTGAGDLPRPSGPVPVRNEADTLFGTTILPAAGRPGAVTKRMSSRMLAQIKAEDPRKRKMKRQVKKAGLRSVPVLVALGLHLAAGAVFAFIAAAAIIEKNRLAYEVSLQKQIEDQKKDIEEEKEKDAEVPDPTKDNVDESAEETDEPLPDNQRVHQGKLMSIPDPNAPPEDRQQGNVPMIQRRAGSVGGGGRWPAVEMGLEWLKRHQDKDGKWDWVGYTAHCKPGTCQCPHGVHESIVREGRNFTTGLTGLAILCFLGSGYTHTELPKEVLEGDTSKVYIKKHGEFRPTVARGFAYLKSVQMKDGCFGPKSHEQFEGYMYNHGICSLAVIEGFQMTNDPVLKAMAEKALDFIAASRSKTQGGWDYVSYSDPAHSKNTRCDISVSSWQVMALSSALDAGLPIDDATWKGARKYFREMTDKRTWAMRYASGKTGSGQGQATPEHLARDSIGVTAAGLLCKLYLGEPTSSSEIRNGASLLILELPDPARVRDKAPPGIAFNFHSVYYWYYGTLVMFHLGGEYWKTWQEHLVEMLKQTQNTGMAKGTWEPEGEFMGAYAGRLYATVFNILNLEVFYRFLPLYKKQEAMKAKEAAKTETAAATLEELLSRIKPSKRKADRDSQIGTLREVCERFGSDKTALTALANVLRDDRFSGSARNAAFMGLKSAGQAGLPFLRGVFLQVDNNFKQMIMVVFRDHKDKESAGVLEAVADSQNVSKGVREQARALLTTLKSR